MKWTNYQWRWLEDSAPRKISLKARQIGMTTAIGAEALALAEADKCDVLVLSTTERQSMNVLRRIYGFINIAKRRFGIQLKGENKSEATLPNGARIISLPASERSVRGYTGHVFLDEFAFHQDAESIWRAIVPVTTRGYKVRVISTPAGKSGKFFELWENGEEWSKHRIDIHQAMADGLEIDLDSIRAGCQLDDFRQEYECEFLDEHYALFPYDLIYRAVSETDISIEPWEQQDGIWYIGVDIGRKRDITAIVALDVSADGVMRARAVRELKNAPFQEQRAEIEAAIAALNPCRVCIDSTGIGMQIAEELSHRYGHIVEPVNFTATVKADLASASRAVFDQNRIKIPDNRELISDIHRLKKIVTSAGNVRYDADRDESGHADRFWALALAVHAAWQEWIASANGKVEVFTAPASGLRDTLRGYWQ